MKPSHVGRHASSILNPSTPSTSTDFGTCVHPQVEKMLQLHLACEQRIGVIIVGPSGSGKSTLWEVGDNYEQTNG